MKSLDKKKPVEDNLKEKHSTGKTKELESWQIDKGTQEAENKVAKNFYDKAVKPKELPMIHKQYRVLSNKKSETQTKELDWCWQKEFLSSGSMNGCGDLSIMISTVSNILTQQRTELLEEILNLECLKEEKYTIVGAKFGTESGEFEEYIGDGEKEWKDPRNELRKDIKEEIKNL